MKKYCVALAALCSLAGGAQAQRDTAFSALPLWGGAAVQKLDMSDDYRSLNLAVPLPALPYMPRLSYHRHAYEVQRHSGAWHSGGAHTVQAQLPFGLTLEAGNRLDRFGRDDEEFIGLTFTYSRLRHHNNLVAAYKGNPQPGPIYDDRAPDAKAGEADKGRFWKIAGSVALVAVLAGGGGGGNNMAAGLPDDDDDDAPQFSRDSGRDGGTNGTWQIVWNDEFDGNSLDLTKWNTDDSWGRDQCFGGGNGEAQCYTDNAENISVNGGHLTLTAQPADGLAQGRSYTSGRIQSSGKGDFTYGKFEARMKFPIASGAWPAFWMLPTAPTAYALNGQDWPRSGEIDIIENANGDPGRLGGAIHFKDPTKSGVHDHKYLSRDSMEVPVDQWHDYRVDWHPDKIQWFLDGEKYFELSRGSWNNGDYPVDPVSDHAPFDQNFHMIINLALSDNGFYTRAPLDRAAFAGGQSMQVDWVRVYECSAGANFCQHE